MKILILLCLLATSFLALVCAHDEHAKKIARKDEFNRISGAKFRDFDSTASSIFSLGNASDPRFDTLTQHLFQEDAIDGFNYTLSSEGRTFQFFGKDQVIGGFRILVPHYVTRETYPPVTDLDDDVGQGITYSDVHNLRSGNFHATVIHTFTNTTNSSPNCVNSYLQFGHHTMRVEEVSPNDIRMVYATLINYDTLLVRQGCP